VSKQFIFFKISIQVFKDRRCCSTRAAVATFIIVALLLIAAGISAGVVFSVIKADNSSISQNNHADFGCKF